MKATFDYSGAKVFVFGGTSGINLGVAECFAKAGATVAVASRSQEKVDAAVDLLSAFGPALGFAVDVRDSQAVADALADFHRASGEIDVLISGAAGNFPATAVSMSPNGFKAVVDIDLMGTFHVLRAGYQYLRKPGASVINISAPQSSIAMAMQSHVCAAKAGVDMLTKSLAIEWGPAGVRVNAIVPGPIEGTEGMDRLAPNEESAAAVRNSVPLRRYGVAEEIGAACLYISSEAASYVSGAIFPVDGGWLAAGVPVSLGG
jgi:NAD(P)-dependent dehydrogenase (short-subunit alcohol dehydrogenase family)